MPEILLKASSTAVVLVFISCIASPKSAAPSSDVSVSTVFRASVEPNSLPITSRLPPVASDRVSRNPESPCAFNPATEKSIPSCSASFCASDVGLMMFDNAAFKPVVALDV